MAARIDGLADETALLFVAAQPRTIIAGSPMTTTLGIDLGTSKCCVHVFEGGAARLVTSADGRPCTPSVVAFGDDEQVLVGAAAQRQATTNAARTVFNVKRLLGRKHHAPDVEWLSDVCPYPLVAASNGDSWVQIDGKNHPPQEIAGLLLEHLKTTAESQLGGPVERAVIAVPALFNDLQRQAIIEAATLAGLDARLIAATTAAALAHCAASPRQRRLAVFDLGGGCFDVSLIEQLPDGLRVQATAGDTLLGGEDFDRRLVAHLVERFYETERVDLGGNPEALSRLHEAARAVRHELSIQPQSLPLHLPSIASRSGEPLALHHDGLTRDQLVQLTQTELDALTEPSAWVLEDVGLGTDDIDELVLLGGMAQMPAVRESVELMFRTRAEPIANPDLAVAKGAALAAAILDGELDIALEEVTPHSLGIKVRGGRFSPIIPRSHHLPCREEKVFTPAREAQDHVLFEIYQGESELVVDNAYLGRFTIDGLQPRTPLVLEFAVDHDGLLHVASITPHTGELVSVDLQRSGGLNETQIRSLRADQQRRKASPRAPEASGPADAPPSAPTPWLAEAGQLSPPAVHAATAPTMTAPKRLRSSMRPPRPPRNLSEPPPATLQLADDALVGEILGGRYEIMSIIADGGMGRVYRARHQLLNRTFAVKVLHNELAANNELAERFVREAQAAATIANEHVVAISDFGRLDDGTGYFVMEFLDGMTLGDLIDERGALPAAMIRDLGSQIATGLNAAHQVDVIHRDLKPANVTLVERGGRPYFCKIVDFGIAKCATSDSSRKLTHVGALLGTPHYMAPEQVDGEADARTDIYGLGGVLYHMATGTPPFQGDSVLSILLKHRSEPPQAIREHDVAAHFPEALEAVILKCLSKDPDDRYGSALELIDALTEA